MKILPEYWIVANFSHWWNRIHFRLKVKLSHQIISMRLWSIQVKLTATQLRFSGLADELPTTWLLAEPSEDDREAAVDDGIIALGNRELYEETLPIVPMNTPSYRHQRAVSTTAEARQLAKRGYIENFATLSLAKRSATKPIYFDHKASADLDMNSCIRSIFNVQIFVW